jgi:hypothetical protein
MTRDDITPIDPLDFVRRNGWRFFLSQPNPVDALGYLVGDAVILGFECTASRDEDWWMVSSTGDWLDIPRISPAEIFFQIVPAPEQGLQAMRHEILLTAFATDVWTFDGHWHQLVGASQLPSTVQSRVTGRVRRAVGFRWPFQA